MVRRRLGRTGFTVSPIGFGAFKIGRNVGIKYPSGYDLPDMPEVERLLHGVLDMGINYIDTAPAYGLSEERIGAVLSGRRGEFVLSTKVGERFADGRSTYDFSARAVRASVYASLARLRTEVIDVVLIHSDGRDLRIIHHTEAVPTLQALREEGLVRAIGMSGKTVEGAEAALDWADVLMVQYHMNDRTHEAVMAQAKARGIGVVVKKGLESGHLPAEHAVRFVLGNHDVSSLVAGSLSLAHLQENLATATEAASW